MKELAQFGLGEYAKNQVTPEQKQEDKEPVQSKDTNNTNEDKEDTMVERLASVEQGVQTIISTMREDKIKESSATNAKILSDLIDKSEFAKGGSEAKELLSQTAITQFLKNPNLGMQRHFEAAQDRLAKVYPQSKGKIISEKLKDQIETEIGGGGIPGIEGGKGDKPFTAKDLFKGSIRKSILERVRMKV